MKTTFILLALLACSGCRKNKSDEALNTLPDNTQTGANTLGFKLNSLVWTTNGKYCYNQYGNCRDNPLATRYPYSGGVLALTADRLIYKSQSVDPNESLKIDIRRNFNRAGIYRLSGTDSLFNMQFTNNNTGGYYALQPGRESVVLNITRLDTLARIVSGEFSGVLYKSDNSNDSIVISEGRFDIRLR